MPPPLEVPRDYEGFWGPPTATLEWCERNYEHSYYIAEFWNTVTNFSMIIPPLYGLWACRKQGFERRFIVCYLMLLLIGIGSWMFHMTLLYEMQLLDEIPMVFGSAVLIYAIHQVRKPSEDKSLGLALGLFVYCLAFVLVYLEIKNPLFHEFMYGLLVVAMVILDLKLTLDMYTTFNMKLFVFGILMYLTGFILWNIDNHFCPQIEAIRLSQPSYLRPLTQLHGWWHILAGYATYLQIVAVIFLRQTYLKEDCHYTMKWVGLVVERTQIKKMS